MSQTVEESAFVGDNSMVAAAGFENAAKDVIDGGCVLVMSGEAKRVRVRHHSVATTL